MTNRAHFFLLLFAALMLLPACGNIDKLVESGNYDAAIERAQRNLTGKQRKNPRYVMALEEAVNRANARDVQIANDLKARGSSTDWTAVFRVYDNINRRQIALQPLIPLVDKDGYEARFRFVRVQPLLTEARENAAAQTYAEAQGLLNEGRLGNKAAARQAYATLEQVNYYLTGYRNTPQLLREAEELGIVYVVLQLENRSRAYLPAGFENELMNLRNVNMDSQWRRFHLQPVRGQTYDYRAILAIDDIAVSPERVTERIYTDEKEITEGEEYVLDENGNVAKDSLGNDITRPRQVIIRADVVEVLQTKNALVSGSLEISDLNTGRIMERRQLTAEGVFENYASTFQGDRRALSDQTRQRLGNSPIPFPTDESLILLAADQLKPILQTELAGSMNLL
ncbi:MAG: hypothetical protein AAGF87_14120 [Bacteroidota bacterium]